jgi:hypothetical protein
MAEIHWALLCQRGIVDRFTNNLSIMEVVNEIAVDRLPEVGAGEASDDSRESRGIALGCQLVTLWARSDPEKPEKFWQRVTITTPDGQEHSAPGDRLVGDLVDHNRTRLLTGIRVIPYRGPGIYMFNVLYAESESDEGELVHRVPVEMKVTEGRRTTE